LTREKDLEPVQDQEIIDSYGGLDNTPSYLVRLRPVLTINKERIIVAQDGLPMGTDYNLTIELLSPSVNGGATPAETITNTMITGNLSVIGITAGKAVQGSEFSVQSEKDAERLLYEEAMNYIDRWNKAEDELASLFHLTLARPLPTVVTVGGVIDVDCLLDMPHGFTWKGVFIDADLRAIEIIPSSPPFDKGGLGGFLEDRQKLFMQLSSLQGSVLENRIFEDDFKVQSISTAKLFQVVNSQPGTSMVTIDSSNIATMLPTLPLDDNIKEDIINSVNQNFVIKIPVQELTYENWTGIGYIKENLATGESGFMLSGSIAGGMTSWGLDLWPSVMLGILQNTYSEPPNYDPSTARSIQKIAATDQQNGAVGMPLTQKLQVKVTDSNQHAVSGVQVTFTIKAGGGKFDNGTGTITATTNNAGIASVRLFLGQKTSANPTFMQQTESGLSNPYGEAIQVGENIVDAALPTGTGITTPFTAYGFPKEPHHLKPLYPLGDTWNLILSFAGLASVTVEDEYDNPVSNVPVTFTAGDPVQNPDTPNCAWTAQDSRKTYFTETGLACIKNSPTWGTCGDTLASSLTVTSGHAGASAQVIMGGMEDAFYTIKAKTLNYSASFTFKTLDSYDGGQCPRINDPLRQLIPAYTYPADPYGNSINAGKVGTTIPVQAKLYYLVENEEQKNVSLACGSGTLTCSKIVGTRQYAATTDFTSSSVAFSGITGPTTGGGVYKANYSLQPGLNTINIDGTATIPINKTTMACPSTCNTEYNVPLTQTVKATMQVYGVDVLINTSGQVFINEKGYSLNDLKVNYTIAPSEYQVFYFKTSEPMQRARFRLRKKA